MRTAYTLDRPPPRAPGEVGKWVEAAGWLIAFALVLAAVRRHARRSPVRAGQRPARRRATAAVIGCPVRSSTKSH